MDDTRGMDIKPIYREIKSVRQIVAEHVLDVVADRLLSVIDEMDRAEREREGEDPERFDGME